MENIFQTNLKRRTFLQLSAAAVAAVASVPGLAVASPQQLKIALEEKWVPTVCTGCNGRCATAVRVVGGVAVKIEGLNAQSPGPTGNVLSHDPIYNGKICAKGATALEQMYNPDRIKYPIIRVGERGSGRWKRISWKEAYNKIVVGDNNEGINWKGLRDHHGKWNPEAGLHTKNGPVDGPNPSEDLIRFPETMVNAWGRHQADWYQGPWLMSYGHYPYRYQR
jgi:anaerobic selenocysteine-containing dehydrogenase